jgi:hypothetical protein
MMSKISVIVAALVGGLVLSPAAMALDLSNGNWQGAGAPVKVAVKNNQVTINGKKATRTINNPDFAEWKGAGYTLSFTRSENQVSAEWAKQHAHGALVQAASTATTSSKQALKAQDLKGLNTSGVEKKLLAEGWKEVYPYTEYTRDGKRVKIQYRADYVTSVTVE